MGEYHEDKCPECGQEMVSELYEGKYYLNCEECEISVWDSARKEVE